MKTLLAALILAICTSSVTFADNWPELKWEQLIPKQWDPRKEFQSLDLSRLQDSDPRAIAALEKMRTTWDNAPTESTLDGRRLRIAGFAIPLERQGDKVTEFLLVPYFGACIHSPPPPANQIIHAVAARPIAGMRSMEALWVYGTLAVQRRNTDWGVAGYRLAVDKTAPYELPKRQ